MRQVLLAGLLLLAGLGTAGFGPPVMTDGGHPPVRLYPEQVDAVARLARPPLLTAKAALALDLDSGQILYRSGEHEPLAPASTVKLMTAVLALRRSGLDEVVTVSAQAAAQGGSRMGLDAGESVTVRDLLYGLLLPSGNDAAVALAEHIAGSEEDFVVLMNQAAAEMGLTETHFTSSHGLDDRARSSAADLARLAAEAMQYPVFNEIVGSASAQVAGRTLANTNELLGVYPGADGVKTGTTDAAGECLVASATRDGHRTLAVVLGSEDRYGDMRALLDYAAENWRWRRVVLPGDALAWERGADGRLYRLQVTTASDVYLPAWQWPLAQPVRAIDTAVPLTGTLPVGTLTLTLADQAITRVPLAVWPGP